MGSRNVPARTAGWFASTYWNSEAAQARFAGRRRRRARASRPRSAVAPRQIGERPPFLRVTDARHASPPPRGITGSRACLVPGERARQVREPRLRPRRLRPVDLGHRADDAHQPRQARRAPLGNERVDVGRDGVEDARRDRLEAREQRRTSETSRRSPENDAGTRREEDASASSSSAPTSDVSRTDRGTERQRAARPRVSGSGRPPETSARRPRARLRDADTHVPSASPTGDAPTRALDSVRAGFRAGIKVFVKMLTRPVRFKLKPPDSTRAAIVGCHL